MSRDLPSAIHLRVFFPTRQVVDVDVPSVSIPGLEGSLGILPGHRSLLTVLGEGQVSFQANGRQNTISVKGGYAEIRPDRVLIFTRPGKTPDEKPHEV